MARELFTVYGSASPTASNQSGDFTLTSPLVRGGFTYIRIPKGMRLKVWAKRLAGTAGFTLQIQYTPDVTAASPAWTPLDAEHLASPGSLELEKRRPAAVYGRTGKEAVKLSYANTTGSGTIYAAAEVEVTDEE
jgi:hypothetical protein